MEAKQPKVETEKISPENRQKPETTEAMTTEVARKQPSDGLVSQPSQPIFQIDPKMAKLAKQFGIPIDQIIEYAQLQDARITQIENYLNNLGVKLEPVIALGEQIQKARANPQPSSNPGVPTGGAGQIMPMILQALGSGGGGMSEEMMNLNKRMMEMSINRMQADIGFTEAIKNAVVTQIAGKAAKSLGT